MKAERIQAIETNTLPYAAGFCWSTGILMEKFIKSLAQKEIWAAKCPRCGYTYVPPRNRCGQCDAKIEEKDLVRLSGKGILVGFTKAYVQLDASSKFVDLDEPIFIGAIKLDGADSNLFMQIADIEPQDIKEGIKVQVEWQKETKGELADIRYFKHFEG
ncbi:MAG: Zn-ribbon domain-containing OB-fold protein [Proteobacteria bacterium]|nr:Zn-ribbon domain-containing OB-fold protein [Pseudomonadota bacterium]